MTDSAIQAFANLLRDGDEQERKSLLARVNLLAMSEATPESFEAPIRTLGDYLDDPIEVPPVLVHPFTIVRGGLACSIGRAGKGKTVMNLNRMLKWACGEPWLPDWKDEDDEVYLRPDKPLRILIIENEGAAGLFHRQVGIMTNATAFLSDEQRDLVRENVLIWGDGGYSNLKLDDPNKLNEVRAGCEKWEPDIIFAEPFRKLWTGEENSSTEMAAAVDALSGVANDYGCGIVISHHERKSGTGDDGEEMSAGRGSTVLEGEAALMENFRSVQNGNYRELGCSKNRYGPFFPTVRLQWVPEACWYNWVPSSVLSQRIEQVLLDNPDEALNVKAISEETGEKAPKLREALAEMVKDNRVKKMSSISDQGGSTGFRYRLNRSDPDAGGGLSL